MFPREACWREARPSSLKKTARPRPRLGARGLGTAKMSPTLWTGLAQPEDIPSIQSAARGTYWVAEGALRSQRFQEAKQPRQRPSPWTRLMLNRWKKCIPMTIINNQRLAVAGSWPAESLGAGLCPLFHTRLSAARNPSHPPPCTKPRESEQRGRNHFLHTFSFKM